MRRRALIRHWPYDGTMVRSRAACVLAIACLALTACGSSSDAGSGTPLGDTGGDSSSQPDTGAYRDADEGDTHFVIDSSTDGGPPAIARVYANTDKDLWRMDPATKNVTIIGPFVGVDGTPLADTMTDVAVNRAGDVWSNSTSKVFSLALPAGDAAGNVVATQKVAITSGTRFYALAFAPIGVLDPSAEVLVAGDAAGDLYLIPTTGATSTPAKIGGFGTVLAGDPGAGAAGDYWQLSGDVAFFDNAGVPIGLATLRPCTKPVDTSTCKNGNDVLVEIDMDALKKKDAASNLKKRFFGTSGTGFGRLYGVGAWGSEVFAFQRVTSTGGTSSALFLSVSLTDGKGTVLKDFPAIAAAANGWSGAGVTTSAKIDLPR
jgi:hypothetical protein